MLSSSLLLALLLVLGTALLPGGPPSVGSLSASAVARAPHAHNSALKKSLLDLVNQRRASHGLRALRRSSALDKAARWQSRDMVSRGYFGHERRGGPSLPQRVRRTGYLSGARGWDLGENLALGEGVQSAGAIVAAWMASPIHREEILYRRYRQIGIGLVDGSPYGRGQSNSVTITTDFGARQ
jgi:uncharacterized protein YkwD